MPFSNTALLLLIREAAGSMRLSKALNGPPRGIALFDVLRCPNFQLSIRAERLALSAGALGVLGLLQPDSADVVHRARSAQKTQGVQIGAERAAIVRIHLRRTLIQRQGAVQLPHAIEVIAQIVVGREAVRVALDRVGRFDALPVRGLSVAERTASSQERHPSNGLRTARSAAVRRPSRRGLGHRDATAEG
jgi:hypothetical protein